MRLTRYASLGHYHEHLDPVWLALPESWRGEAWSALDAHPGTTPYRGTRGAHTATGAVLVASWPDAVSAAARGRELVYLEHGAGQAYEGDPAMAGARGWSGADDPTLDRVRLFVCPSETVADRWRARYTARAVAVGCPKLDAWHRGARGVARGVRPVVAVTFHWDCPLGPETRTAWPHYDRALAGLAAWCRGNAVDLIGHGHPRMWSRIRRRWQHLGVEPVQHLADVLDRADVLVADNTSAMYEFASLGRPVVVLNAPWYRRDIEHGMRFWSAVPGRQVDRPGDLVPAVEQALAGDDTAGLRAAATAAAYASCDGRAAERAATAIMEALS